MKRRKAVCLDELLPWEFERVDGAARASDVGGAAYEEDFVPGLCYDACPAGQKVDGRPNDDWIRRRHRMVLTGTRFGKILPKGHPLKYSYGSWEDELSRFVFQSMDPIAPRAQARMDRGTALEPEIDRMFREQYGYELDYPGLLVSRVQPLWGGSPDGVDRQRRFIVEYKAAVDREIQQDADGNAVIPSYYYAQSHLYMWTTGIRRCAFVQYHDNDRAGKRGQIQVTWMEYDEEAMRTALEVAAGFTEVAVALMAQWKARIAALHRIVDYLDRGKSARGESVGCERLPDARAMLEQAWNDAENTLNDNCREVKRRCVQPRRDADVPQLAGASGDFVAKLRAAMENKK